MSSSSRSTLPWTVAPGMTSCMRLSERRNVDLPQPDGPMKAVTVLGSMVKVTPSTATLLPYDAVRPSTSNRLAICSFRPLLDESVPTREQARTDVQDDNHCNEREGPGP